MTADLAAAEPAPPGLTWRRVDPATDAPAILELGLHNDVRDIGEPDWELSDVVDELSAPGFDPATDSWLLHDEDGRLMGLGMAYSRGTGEIVDGDIYAREHPDEPGWLRWLLARVEERARAMGAPEVRVFGVAGSQRMQLLAADGWRMVRLFRRMERNLDGSEVAPTPPAGVVIRQVDARDEADLRLVHRLDEESFADHFGHVASTWERFYAENVASESYVPALWWIAEVDGVPQGFLVGRQQDDKGWVKLVGVLPAARGRGVARALLGTAFAAFAAQGETKVGLGVDSENATGAMGLYESVGMRATYRFECWQRALT